MSGGDVGDTSYIAVSGAIARLRQLEVLSHNLANVDTTGYKRSRVLFESALESAVRNVEGEPAEGAPGNVFVTTRGTELDLTAGGVRRTGAPLDAAIEGKGFFELQGPEGPRYTRAGSFGLDAQGQLVTPDGVPVVGDGGPIQAGSRPLQIQPSGEIVDDTGAVLGRLRVVEFDDPRQLIPIGSTQFKAGLAVPTPLESPRVLPGSLEGSNVQPTRELAELLMLQRSFDMNLQVLRADDESTQRLIREISQ